jgi:hypothetical protein
MRPSPWWSGLLFLSCCAEAAELATTSPPDDETGLMGATLQYRSVDILFSIGVTDGTYSCSAGDQRHCSLYSVKVNLDSNTLLSHSLVSESRSINGMRHGFLRPAVSPGGTHVAYSMHRDGAHAYVMTNRLAGYDAESAFTSDDMYTSDENSEHDHDGENGRMLAWRTDDELLFSWEDLDCSTEGATAQTCPHLVDHWNDVWSARAEYSGSFAVRDSTPTILLGAGSTVSHSYADPAVHPTNRNVVAVHGRDADEEPGTGKPEVVDLSTGASYAFDLKIRSDLTLEACAHTAWNPDGTQVLCTEQNSNGTSATLNGQSVNADRIYAFKKVQRKASPPVYATTNGETLFKHKTPQTLVDELGYDADCTSFLHKYAEWCGGHDFIVATVFCNLSTGDGETETLTSRVFLIDISNPDSAGYLDLTSELRDRLVESGHGEYDTANVTSVSATCTNFHTPI